MTDRIRAQRAKTDRVAADRAQAAEQTRTQISVGQIVRDRVTGRTGTVAGVYGTGSTRQYLLNLDIAAGSTRRATDIAYRDRAQVELL